MANSNLATSPDPETSGGERAAAAPKRNTKIALASKALLGFLALWVPLVSLGFGGETQTPTIEAKTAHLDRVRRAEFCAGCHPEATAEHRLNTHGRAFTDAEVRLATAEFTIPGCIDCHTPRPVFETGIGKNPIKRNHHLEEGNDCLSCHAKADYDFAQFQGGPDCKVAFDNRVGTVEACASCHRNHGTPYQWENAAHGKKAGNVCIDCHMPEVERPVAVGMQPTKTRRHTFFASRSPSQLRMAYEYSAALDGNEVNVTIENAGAGHNFPTELKQRAVESLVIIRDTSGREVARSRQIFRDPYKRPYGLNLPVNTQIPSGEKRNHRVPIPIEAGTVETTLFYKLYYPIEDTHPDLSRTLESRSFAFGPIEPSKKLITTMPEIQAQLPEALPAEAASPGNLADFARPKIDKVEVDIPDGTKDGDVAKLIALFQFPMYEANRKAADVLVKMGEPVVGPLVEAMGSWDSKTWMQSQQALIRMGKVAIPGVVKGLAHPELYVRFHACEILPRLDRDELLQSGIAAKLNAQLQSKNPLDARSAADAALGLRLKECIPILRGLLDSLDFDVVASASRALGGLEDKDSAAKLKQTLARVASITETARDVAWSLAALGEPAGADFLLASLDYPDDLVRGSCFEAWLDVTGVSLGFANGLPHESRLAALAEIRNWWAQHRGAKALRRPRSLETDAKLNAEVHKLMRDAGGNDVASGDADTTEKAIARLVEIGKPGIPYVIEGLKWPSGFIDKRVAMLRVLCQVPDPDALPALLEAVHDPALTTSLWAAQALELLGDPHALPALLSLQTRFDEAAAANKVPAALGHPEDSRILLGRARMSLGDPGGARLLLRLLFSQEPTARSAAEAVMRAAVDDPKYAKAPWLADARVELDALRERLRAQAVAMRATWQQFDAAAEAAGDEAKTREQILDALVKFDFAEEACTRYWVLDPRAFAVDFRRTTAAADELSQKLYDDAAFREGIVARDLLSLVERRGFSQSSAGILTSIQNSADQGSRLTLESPADSAGGIVNFGLGGAGGSTVPMEWWRDYEILFDVEIVKKGVWLLDRYDPIWAIFQRTSMSVEAPEQSGVLHAPVAEGKQYRVRHAVFGSDVIHQQSEISANGDGAPGQTQEYRTTTGTRVRKGGLVLQLEPGAKVVIKNLRLKVYRSDAAETVNAQMATPGR